MRDAEELFVSFDDNIKGPFDKGQINAFIISGLYPACLKISETNNGPWRDYKYVASSLSNKSNLVKEIASTNTTRSTPIAPKSKNGLVAWLKDTGGGIALLVIIIGGLALTRSCNNQTHSESNSNYRSSPSPSDSDHGNASSSSASHRVKTYSVSHNEHIRLQQMSARIESYRSSLNGDKARLQSIDNEIDNERISLDHSNSYAIDSFNQKVRKRNLLNNKYQESLRAFNYEVDSYNNELRKSGRPKN